MKLKDVLKVIDDFTMLEIAYIDKDNRSKLFKDFDYSRLKELYRWDCREMLQRDAIMNHEAYDILKDYEVIYLVSNTVDYDDTVIRITLKIEEA